MTKPDEDRPVDTVGYEQQQRLARRAADPSPFENLQDRVRKSGLRRNEDGSYETNEGKVVLESPTEAKRREIYAASKETRRSYFGYKGRDPVTELMAKQFAGDPELDIDWGDYAPIPETIPMFHGRCVRGPYHNLMLAHPEKTMVVATEAGTGRALVGQIGSSVQHPDIKWFAYVWEEDDKKWLWDDSPRQPPE